MGPSSLHDIQKNDVEMWASFASRMAFLGATKLILAGAHGESKMVLYSGVCLAHLS
jgi:hypothetical protein